MPRVHGVHMCVCVCVYVRVHVCIYRWLVWKFELGAQTLSGLITQVHIKDTYKGRIITGLHIKGHI